MRTIAGGISALIVVALLGCTSNGRTEADFTVSAYTPRYATGFEILAPDDTTASERLLVTRSAWQGDGGARTTLIIDSVPAHRIVAMSSSHVAMLDALGIGDRIVGVSGKRFLSTPSVVRRLDEIADVGYDGNIDYELLMSIRPDIVMLYGVNGASSMEGKLKELGIPFVYVGDYMEESPLGKAEWLRFVAEITGRQPTADSLLTAIADRYNSLATLASEASARPRIMLNMPVGDQWYLPTPGGYMPRLIADAGGKYLFESTDPKTTVPVDFETAYRLLSAADIWLNPGSVTDIASLRALAPKLSDTRPAKDGKVFNNNARTTAGGGNDFWESSIVKPDEVLADLISIIHPELLPDRQLYYYREIK